MSLRNRGYSLMEQEEGGAILWSIYKYGKGAEAVANSIMHDFGNPLPKLKGVLTLLKSGHKVKVGDLDITQLYVDGKKWDWDKLDKVSYKKESLEERFGRANDIKKFFAAQLDSSQEAMFNEVVLMAMNEGRFYPKRDAKGAVDYAIKEYIKNKNQEMREDSRVVHKHAVKEVKRQWGPKGK